MMFCVCVCVFSLSLCLQFEVNRLVCIQLLSLSAQTLFSPEPPDLHLSLPLIHFFSHFNSLPPCFSLFVISVGVSLSSLTIAQSRSLGLPFLCVFYLCFWFGLFILVFFPYANISILLVTQRRPKYLPLISLLYSLYAFFLILLFFLSLRTREGQMCGVRVFHRARDRDHDRKYGQHTQ